MMLEESVGFTATHGSSSVFTKLVSPGIKNPEMSHEAKGLSPLAGGLGVPDAWCTTVVTYGPAAAGASGIRIIRAETTAAARGMPFLMAHLHRIEPKRRLIFLTRPRRVKQFAGVPPLWWTPERLVGRCPIRQEPPEARRVR